MHYIRLIDYKACPDIGLVDMAHYTTPGGNIQCFLLFLLSIHNSSAQMADWICRFQNTTCGIVFEHGQWNLVQEPGQMNVYLEANFTGQSYQEGDTATFIIDREFNSYAGEIQFFFFSATVSSPDMTNSKQGSFSITACRNNDRPLFYIKHYQWEWMFIEGLPFSCNNREDVEIKVTATNGGSSTVIRVDAILIFEMPSSPETAIGENSTNHPYTMIPQGNDFPIGESNEKEDPCQVTMILSIALAVTTTLFVCTLIIIAILFFDQGRSLPDAAIKFNSNSEDKSSCRESPVNRFSYIQTVSRDVPDGASPDNAEVIWNRMQMESAEVEFVELKDALSHVSCRGLGDAEKAAVNTEMEHPKCNLESKAKKKMPHRSSRQVCIGQKSTNRIGKTIAHPEASFKVDLDCLEGKLDFVGNPIYHRIPNGHTQTANGHSSRGDDGQTDSCREDVWFGLGITFYRNKAAEDAGLMDSTLAHQLYDIPEEPEYAAHVTTNHAKNRDRNDPHSEEARSTSTASGRRINGNDADESFC